MELLLLLTMLIIGQCIRESQFLYFPPQFRGIIATVAVKNRGSRQSLSSHSQFQPSYSMMDREYLIQLKRSIKLSSLLQKVYDIEMTIVGKNYVSLYHECIYDITCCPSHTGHIVYVAHVYINFFSWVYAVTTRPMKYLYVCCI